MRIIAGKYKGRKIKTCFGPGYRPATGRVRESLFSMLEARGMFWPEAAVLDVFAGSGSLGLESLSRGARKVVFWEKNARAANSIRANLRLFDIPETRAEVLCTDVFKILVRDAESSFDLVFIDPPYGKDMLVPALQGLIAHGWINEHALIVAEVENRLELGHLFRENLTLLKDKFFGQTRIYIWEKKDA
jgi:16S rRNA (guanine966-N2)-methyltransferase